MLKVGRKGVIYLVQQNGKTQKCGLRIHAGCIEVFNRSTREWEPLPELLKVGGKSVAVTVIEWE